jgi:hypothetical protein
LKSGSVPFRKGEDMVETKLPIKAVLDSYIERLESFPDPLTKLTLLHSFLKTQGYELDKSGYKINLLAWLITIPEYRKKEWWKINLEADMLLAKAGIR